MKCLHLLATILLLPTSSTTAASEISQNVEHVIVSATRSERVSPPIPVAVAVITKNDIAASGANHLADVLRGHAGIQISDLFGDGSRATIDMRGFGATASQNTLVLVDGRRLNNADLGIPDLNSIALKDVERIEIVQGSVASLYGDKAVGGAINIIMRRPEQLDARIEGDAGSYGRKRLALTGENRHENGIGYRVSAERRLSDNYRDNNDQQYSNVFAQLDFEHSSGRAFLEYQNIDENIETPGALFRDLVEADRKQTINPADFIDTDTWIVRFGIDQALTKNWSLQTEYTNRKSDSDGILSSFGAQNFLLLKRHHIELTPRLLGQYSLPGGTAHLTVGSDLFSTDYSLFSSVGTTINEQERYSVYAQAVIPLTERLVATLGARHADVENDIFASTTFLGVSLPPGSEIDDDANAGSAGVSYQVIDDWRVFARADANYRFANADEFSGIANFNVFPFPGPLPFPTTQTGVGYDFGVEWRRGRNQARAALYRMEIDDEIAFEPSSGQNFNIGDSRRHGVNVQVAYYPFERLRIDAHYSYVDAELTSGSFDGSDITFVAEHSGHIRGDYQFGKSFGVFLELTGTSERVLNGDFNNDLAPLPGYVVANLNVRYAYKSISVAARVNNLLDKEYSDAGSLGFDFRDAFQVVETFFPAPERNFFVTLRVDL